MQISRAHDIMRQAMDARALRQDLVSSNIANVDTPFYRPKDVNFEKMLTARANEVFSNIKEPKLDMAQTNSVHFNSLLEDDIDKRTIFFRNGHQARNDGNSVDIDVENTELSKNLIMFNALSAAVKKEAMLFKSVVSSSEKMN